MQGHIILLGIYFILAEEIQSSNGQICAKNESIVDCINPCNTCDRKNTSCTLECVSGCDCISRHTRNSDGICIPKEQCGGSVQPSTPGEMNTTTQPPQGEQDCPDSNACHRSCRRRGFPSGRCIGITCSCQPKPLPTTSAPPPTTDGPIPDGCPDVDKCTALCRDFEYVTGTCIGPDHSSCSCNGFQTTERPGLSDDAPTCPVVRRCIRSCRRQGFRRGFCEGRECRCGDGRPPTINQCHVMDCHLRCVRRGFSYGACAGPANVCRCFT